MKKYFWIALALLMAVGTADLSAQNLLKKVGKAVEKEMSKDSKPAQPAKPQAQQKQEQKSSDTKAPAKKEDVKKEDAKQGEIKYQREIPVFYNTGKQQGKFMLYYDGATYYVKRIKTEDFIKLIPCDGSYGNRKYTFYFMYKGAELWINEKLPGAVGKRELRNRDEDVKKMQQNKN